MTMNIEDRGLRLRAGMADIALRIVAGVMRRTGAIGKARRAARCGRELAGLSDHMRRDLGLPPRAMRREGVVGVRGQ